VHWRPVHADINGARVGAASMSPRVPGFPAWGTHFGSRLATNRYHLSRIARARAGPELNQLALPVRFKLTCRHECMMAEKEQAWETKVARKTRKKTNNSS
jgi:hypothetical protein